MLSLWLRKPKSFVLILKRILSLNLTVKNCGNADCSQKTIATCIIGFFANFLDTLGIGSFAPSSAGFKLTKSVDDILVPGTLNVGDTVPVCVEAFLFFGFVEMDILTLVLMIVVSILGSFVMADIVSKFDRKKVRYALFVGLFLLASVVLMKNLGVGPFGTQGEALGLRGIKLVVAVVGNFILVLL